MLVRTFFITAIVVGMASPAQARKSHKAATPKKVAVAGKRNDAKDVADVNADANTTTQNASANDSNVVNAADANATDANMADAIKPMGADLDWGLVVPYPNTMVVNHQIYELSINGIEDMCNDQPYVCRMKVQRDALDKLERERAMGYTFAGIGFGLAVIGPVTSIVANCGNSTHRCEPNWAAFGTTLAAGTVLGVVGINLLPHQSEIVDFVHTTNKVNPEQPIRLRIGMLPGSAPGFVVAGSF